MDLAITEPLQRVLRHAAQAQVPQLRGNAVIVEYNDIGAAQVAFALPHDNEGKLLSLPKSTAPAVTRYASAGALLTAPTDYARIEVGGRHLSHSVYDLTARVRQIPCDHDLV